MNSPLKLPRCLCVMPDDEFELLPDDETLTAECFRDQRSAAEVTEYWSSESYTRSVNGHISEIHLYCEMK